MAANDKPDAGRQPPSGRIGPEPATGRGGARPTEADDLRLRRQAERIREMERLMRAAAAFARGRPPR